ncbi:DUF3566 domain-containing protein [Pseudonocardia sp. GCM10023141]|uniref:DUF3566 domain-containing protein n=1 Tax=Pseudonocardia sp. GCM10023141 TaxID=3252653 RepID=UPI00360BC707
MNDTTSTPDEPDGHGTVATGDQAGAAPAGKAAAAGNGTPATPDRVVPQPSPRTEQGTESGAAVPGAGGSGAGGSGAAGSNGAGSATDPAPAGTPEAETAPVVTGGSGEPARNPSPGPSSAKPAAGANFAPSYGGDEITKEMRLPSPANGTASAGHDGAGTQQRPATAQVTRPVNAPSPAPGPVPGPGPAAANPPPWARVPGQESMDAATVSVPRPAGGLLDEGPTTFLDAPRPAASNSGAEESEPEGWSPVRAVRNRAPRQASLQLKRLDPWSVLKLALVLAVVLFLVWLVAVGVLYGVLSGMGVWDRLNGTYADLVSGDTPSGSPLISAGRVFGLAAIVGAINSLLFAVAMTVGAFVYNVSADLVGGIEVTLSERD